MLFVIGLLMCFFGMGALTSAPVLGGVVMAVGLLLTVKFNIGQDEEF